MTNSQPAIALCAILLALTSSARGVVEAQDPLSSAFEIDDADPERSVPTKQEALRRPLDMGYQLMLLSEKADAASAAGDHLAAAKYWRAVAKAVPESALAFSRLCREYAAAGDVAGALAQCKTALGKPGVTVDDNAFFVTLLLETSDAPLRPDDIADVTAISEHIEHELPGAAGQLLANRMRCKLASRLGDVGRLSACTQQLQRLAPDAADTLVFAWSLAVKQGHLERAQTLLASADAAKLPASAIERMSAALAVANARQPLWRRMGRGALFAAVAGLLLAVYSAFSLSRRRRRMGGV